MYSEVDPLTDISDSELDNKYNDTVNNWFNNSYNCSTKLDYYNERILLEAKKSKKNKKKDPNAVEISPALGFSWNYVYGNRIKTKVGDILSCSSGQNTQSIEFRNYASTSLQTANTMHSRITTMANEIVQDLIIFRKKSKQYYKDKQPTPSSFWESEISKHFPHIMETTQASIHYHDSIDSSLKQAYRSADLSRGTIPTNFISLIEYVINTLLRVSVSPLVDADISNAVNAHTSSIESLLDYSLGNIMSVIRSVLFDLYNPISGVLITEQTMIQTYLLADLQSFSTILLGRLKQQFQVLADPVFAHLVTPLVMNALFCAAAPMLENCLHSDTDRVFKEGIDSIKENDYKLFEIVDVLINDQSSEILNCVKLIDMAATTPAPYYRIGSYTTVLSNLFSYVSAMYSVQNKEVNSTELLDSIARFIIVMHPDHFPSNLQYCVLFSKCVPQGSVNETTMQCLNRGYSWIQSLLKM